VRLGAKGDSHLLGELSSMPLRRRRSIPRRMQGLEAGGKFRVQATVAGSTRRQSISRSTGAATRVIPANGCGKTCKKASSARRVSYTDLAKTLGATKAVRGAPSARFACSTVDVVVLPR